jgi:ABC-type amino acid transport substrate-binding protein
MRGGFDRAAFGPSGTLLLGIGIAALLALVPGRPGGAETALPIRFVALSTEPAPMAVFRDGQLAGGILKDIGDAIATRMNAAAAFVTLPRLRVDGALDRGEADAICNATPEWYAAKLHWTEPFIDNANLLLMRDGAAPVSRLDQLRGKTIGAVHGYVYPDLDAVIGGPYERDDAASVVNAIQKLKAARFDYAIVDRISLDWEAGKDPSLAALPTLEIRRYKSGCGFSPNGRVSRERASGVIEELVREGAFDRILARYRQMAAIPRPAVE